MTESLPIILDLPPAELSPNTRCHWAKKSRAVKAYRNAAKMLVLEVGLPDSAPWTTAVAKLSFHFDVKRNRDADNLIASMKAAFDGIADAGLIVNDRGLRIGEVRINAGEMVEPCVFVHIEREGVKP